MLGLGLLLSLNVVVRWLERRNRRSFLTQIYFSSVTELSFSTLYSIVNIINTSIYT